MMVNFSQPACSVNIWVDEQRGVVIAVNAGDPEWNDRGPESFEVFREIVRQVAPDPVAADSLDDTGSDSPDEADGSEADPLPEDTDAP